jgi:hypothetical protein
MPVPEGDRAGYLPGAGLAVFNQGFFPKSFSSRLEGDLINQVCPEKFW